MQNLIVETKMFNLSTRGSACNILNEDPNYKSKCEYNIRDMVVRDEDVEYIQFSVPFAIIPVSFFTVNRNNNQLKFLVNGSTTTYTFPSCFATITFNLEIFPRCSSVKICPDPKIKDSPRAKVISFERLTMMEASIKAAN